MSPGIDADVASRLGEAIAAADREGKELAVLVVELGSATRLGSPIDGGDAADIQDRVAGRLTNWTRSTDQVLRIAPERFALVMPGMTRAHAISARVEALLEDLLTIVDVGGRSATVPISIGAAAYPRSGLLPARLLSEAQGAAARARTDGGNCFRWADED